MIERYQPSSAALYGIGGSGSHGVIWRSHQRQHGGVAAAIAASISAINGGSSNISWHVAYQLWAANISGISAAAQWRIEISSMASIKQRRKAARQWQNQRISGIIINGGISWRRHHRIMAASRLAAAGESKAAAK